MPMRCVAHVRGTTVSCHAEQVRDRSPDWPTTAKLNSVAARTVSRIERRAAFVESRFTERNTWSKTRRRGVRHAKR